MAETHNRKFFVGGNWKMNGSTDSISDLVNSFNQGVMSQSVEVVIGAPYVYIPLLASTLRKDIAISAQNCFTKASGAYTGEISADMLKDVGATWVILGHSERRSIFKESDFFIAEKTKYALSVGLKVIFCCGESLEERESNNTMNVVERQLEALIATISPADYENVVIAYEPVWAIGTGKVASPEQAQEVHAHIRTFIKERVSSDVAQNIRIIYGGSVNEKNSNVTATQTDVDGFLVGGASLKPSFFEIVNV
ncbi:Triosephosphate isomerase, cytosolic [Smittium mucronatum]|uniref:Triosephosphate isomerase n=1 Tax=Smittium mucronatum TaxID=133383 RepID=A0A1R0GUE6_9FUNG|nr:Triosephosphate isomerase, cytosolic [Smittium mucronatum]